MEIVFTGVPTVSGEAITHNVNVTHRLGLPDFRSIKPTSKRLAVIGGGPSIREHEDELRSFDGDVWAINGAWAWCKVHGIPARFFTLDPDPIVMRWINGVDKALLCSRVDPQVFYELKGKDVRVFDISQEGGVASGSSTATCAPVLAAALGYTELVFYGCESSYPQDETHAYQHEVREDQLWVTCGGEEYLTAPDFYIQAQELSALIREFPRHFSERSGGLLRALVADPKFDVTAVSRNLFEQLKPIDDTPHIPNKAALGVADNLDAFTPAA